MRFEETAQTEKEPAPSPHRTRTPRGETAQTRMDIPYKPKGQTAQTGPIKYTTVFLHCHVIVFLIIVFTLSSILEESSS
jgi:hypothetical protein